VMLERLQVARAVDEQVGSRRADAAASVGTYLALAAAVRHQVHRHLAGDTSVPIAD
jgi:hypothetical protein